MSGTGKTEEEMHATRVEAGKSENGIFGDLCESGGGEAARRGAAREASEKKRREVVVGVFVAVWRVFSPHFFLPPTIPLETNRGRSHQGGEIRRTPRYCLCSSFLKRRGEEEERKERKENIKTTPTRPLSSL